MGREATMRTEPLPDGWERLDEEEKEMLRLCHLRYLIWLDMVRAPPMPKDERWNRLLGLAICLPLYGYGLYKLFVG